VARYVAALNGQTPLAYMLKISPPPPPPPPPPLPRPPPPPPPLPIFREVSATASISVQERKTFSPFPVVT
jgi:hypothetical protein